ncbi:MAG: AbrB/MazE/SpoVT family DNA-binding domain-containing protein [Oscillospiraceae bacterium]|jgi:transcriptional pleiotropic regulator of transition state genes|nr:AbrB/MazE/SpoVT family DNA-binding domain-containing protein [Oscillospiraceae bacterium]
MKSLGIVRKLDEVGRIVLPKELRRLFQIESSEDAVEIFTEEDRIVLRKYQPSCVFCRSEDDLFVFAGQKVCRECAKKIAVTEDA